MAGPTQAWQRLVAGKQGAHRPVDPPPAKCDGSWEKLDAIESLEIPADLAASFAVHPDSAANFDAFPRSARRGILERIAQARQPATRARRVNEIARMAARNERANQRSPKKQTELAPE